MPISIRGRVGPSRELPNSEPESKPTTVSSAGGKPRLIHSKHWNENVQPVLDRFNTSKEKQRLCRCQSLAAWMGRLDEQGALYREAAKVGGKVTHEAVAGAYPKEKDFYIVPK